MPSQALKIFPDRTSINNLIAVINHTQIPFLVQAVNCIPALDVGGLPTQCLPLYCYDGNGNRIDNITDWALTPLQQPHHHQTRHLSLHLRRPPLSCLPYQIQT